MRLPSLRRPTGASVFAGLLGAGLVDAVLVGSPGAMALVLGLDGVTAVVAGLAADWRSGRCWGHGRPGPPRCAPTRRPIGR